ncbi:MAG: protein-export chaperone SecB [Prevotellaceae bacterium]|jgi:preprotein translocase subunit SecB|nr:protein-export chaperone SecB [Prevotellaceae bacterium]
MEAPVAQFRFVGYKILESNVSLTEDVTLFQNLKINIEQQNGGESEENRYKHIIAVTIKDESDSVKIYVKMVGLFGYDKGIDESTKKNFFNGNAPAILFPYIRAYISALTSLSGIPTIILPTLNLAKML